MRCHDISVCDGVCCTREECETALFATTTGMSTHPPVRLNTTRLPCPYTASYRGSPQEGPAGLLRRKPEVPERALIQRSHSRARSVINNNSIQQQHRQRRARVSYCETHTVRRVVLQKQCPCPIDRDNPDHTQNRLKWHTSISCDVSRHRNLF